MSESTQATPLILHTLETLCTELVSGRAVLLDDEGSEFRLTSPEARSIFDWYRRNENKWAGNVYKQDVEALVDQLEKTPPELLESINTDQSLQRPIIHLKSVRVHRFAGIHRYGEPEQPPDDFEFEFEKPLTLIEGVNGAGKTSLLNAISWCLTGHIYRSQRAPEPVDESVQLEIVEEPNAGSINVGNHDMTAITPLPSAETLTSLGDDTLPLDTWVEVVFSDDEGNEVGTAKRCLERSPRGKIVVDEPDFSSLGLDPLSLEIGTKMPGLIPYIQLGAKSDLGEAISGMTGFKPLQDLTSHAAKSKTKLEKELVKDRNKDIEKINLEFLEAQKRLNSLIKENPDIDPKKSLPDPGLEKTIEEDLRELKAHFDDLQSQALAKAKSILGDSFDHEDQDTRMDLMENVGPALGLLDSSNLRRLPNANRLAKLANLTAEEILQAEAAIEKLIREATEIVKIEKIPGIAARLRLYAKVANWIKEPSDQNHDIKTCSICQRALDGKYDAITGRLISEHIREYVEIDSSHLEKTLKAWEENAKASLLDSLPEPLRAEMTRDLPEKPTDLISSALGEEFFESPHFRGCLTPLKSIAHTLCEKELECLEAFVEPEKIVLPEPLEEGEGSLAHAIRRIARAIAFARWRQDNETDCKKAFSRIIGTIKPGDDEGEEKSEGPLGEKSISECLVALDNMVKSTTPLTAALSEVKSMTETLQQRREKENRISRYSKTAEAIQELLSLDNLVEKQVASLLQKLLSGTQKWRNNFYSPAFVDAPEVTDTDVKTDGSLEMSAAADGTKASAYHISNASDLRATLLSFLITFWQHLLETRGGLSLLLLDDLQELFDRYNRRRVANTIPLLVDKGGRIIVTTNDTVFGRDVTDSANGIIGSEKIDRRRIHTLNAVRQHIELGKFRDAIDKKRNVFERPKHRNEDQPARDYINNLRIYLENRLIDFFDIVDSGIPFNPTLSDLMDGVRSRMKTPLGAFASRAFSKLVSDPALVFKSGFLKLMNQSHHGNEDEITFKEVWSRRDDCLRVQKIVDEAHEEYERGLRGDRRVPVLSMPACPELTSPPSFDDVPVLRDLAAFITEAPTTEVSEVEERFSASWFEDRALYLINTHNFGFAATPNCRAIVDLSDETIIDGMLVIAIHKEKVYARRLLRSTANPNVVVLASEAENPLKRPPTVILPAEEVRLLNVVGILFDDRPNYPRSPEDAVLMSEFNLVEKIQLVFKVKGESATPFVLPGQTVLGGNIVLPSQLNMLEGKPVAIATSDGSSAFKKIGKAVPGNPHVRQFESIGGLGESMLVRIEDIDDSFSALPLLQSIRRVLGVLYETS